MALISRRTGRTIRFTSTILAALLLLLTLTAGADDQIVQVIVNSEPVHEADLQLMIQLSDVASLNDPVTAEAIVDRMIDRELIRRDLETAGIRATPEQVQSALAVLGRRLTQEGETLDQAIARLKLNRTALMRYAGTTAAWDAYVQSEITDERLANEWKDRRDQLDGTRVKAAQIVKLVGEDSPEAKWTDAENQLSILRERIRSGELTFADAAKEFSDSPSGKQGGSLGEFSYSGRFDPAIIEAAFALKPGEVSGPFRTRAAVHLVRTEERVPGTLSPEDVRGQLIAQLDRQLWKEREQSLREKADIRVIKAPIPDRRVLPSANFAVPQ